MAKYSIDDSTLVAIGNAIREKTGTTETMSPSEMVIAISSIESGGGTNIADEIITRTIKEIESGVSCVEDNAFYGSKDLVRAVFPNAGYLGDNSLRDCSSLVEVSIPQVVTLQGSTFRGCSKLKVVDAPKVSTIYTSVFQACTVLETLILRSETVCSMSNTTALTSTPIANGTGFIYVPSSLVDGYKSATNWSTYANQIRAIEDYPEITGG